MILLVFPSLGPVRLLSAVTTQAVRGPHFTFHMQICRIECQPSCRCWIEAGYYCAAHWRLQDIVHCTQSHAILGLGQGIALWHTTIYILPYTIYETTIITVYILGMLICNGPSVAYKSRRIDVFVQIYIGANIY